MEEEKPADPTVGRPDVKLKSQHHKERSKGLDLFAMKGLLRNIPAGRGK